MEQKLKDIENGKELYLRNGNRFKYATIRKIGSTMGFPVYLVEEFTHGMRNYNWVFQDSQKAMESLNKNYYKFV